MTQKPLKQETQAATFLVLVVFHDLILIVVQDPKTIEIRHVGGYVSYCGVGGYVSYSDGFQIHDPKTIIIRNVRGYVCNFGWVHLPLSPTPKPTLEPPKNKKCRGLGFLF